MKWFQGEFWLSDDLADVDMPAVHRLLSTTYWASARPRERTEQALSHSVCFSLKQEAAQIGFARVITDEGCYAIVTDVVIDARFQKRGLGRWLMAVIRSYPRFAGSVMILWTTDQVDFYRACGLSHEAGFKIMRQTPDWMRTGPTA